MKKYFYIADFFLVLITLASIMTYFTHSINLLGNLSISLIIVLAVAHIFFGLAFKSKTQHLYSIPILLGIVLALISSTFVVKNPTTCFVLLCFSEISMIISLICHSKFSLWDLIYIVAIAIPVLILVNTSHLFGYSGISNRLVICILMTLISTLLGLSIANLIKKQNAFNITFTVSAFINFLYGFGLVVIRQSNVTHKLAPFVSLVLYILLLLFSLSILFFNKSANVQNTIKTKTNLTYAVSVLAVALIITYTLISNFVAFNFISPKIYKEKFMSMVGNDLNIPIIEVYTQNNEEPQSKKEYVNCSFKISNCDDETHNFSVPMTKNYEDDGCVGIRLRGNSTKKARKRPYRIKFDDKQSLFGLKSNKSWVLLAEFYDQSYIRNYTAFTLADEFDNLNFSPTPHHVALMMNGEFKGLYLLCEQMDEKKGRANVDDDFDISVDTEFPFLVEMDLNAHMEGTTGIDNFYVESATNHVEIKFPEADERSATETNDPVYDYIYEYINAAFTTMKTGEKVEVSFRPNPVGLEDLVNIDSLVDYYLVNEIMLNVDSGYKSIYLHKTKDGLMEFGPIWDFDLSFSTKLDAPYDKSYIEEAENLWLAKNAIIYQHIFNNETLFDGKTFYDKVVERFDNKKQAIINVCNHLRDYKSKIDKVALIDAKMWHGKTGEFQYDTQYDYARLFLLDRYDYLESVFALSRNEFLELI